MALHHTQKKSAVGKYTAEKEQGKTREEISQLLALDEKGYAAEDIEEILAALFADDSDSNPDEQKNSLPVGQSSANNVDTSSQAPVEPEKEKKLDLGQFNYKGLTGENFKRYEEFVNQLMLHDHYTFEVYKVEPVILDRYPGLEGTPKDFSGIRIVNDTPIHKTHITVKIAKEMNAQVRNTGRYYLLKK